MKNILLIEAGGACAISCIKLLRKHKNLTLIAVDADPTAAGLYLADIGLIMPKSNEVDFLDKLDEVIKKYAVDIVLPCFENGFDILKEYKKPFVNDFNSAILCKDKLRFNQVCKEAGLPVPETSLLDEVSDPTLPVYIKPRRGVGSRDNFIARTRREFSLLKEYLNDRGEFLVQSLLIGTHWNVDVMVDEGDFIKAIPRRDIRQKEGNCICVEVVANDKIEEFAKKVQTNLGIQSPFNLELFEDERGNFTINEINVRFGGGIIFGALSGVDLVSYLVTKDKSYINSPLKKAVYTRYYEEVYNMEDFLTKT